MNDFNIFDLENSINTCLNEDTAAGEFEGSVDADALLSECVLCQSLSHEELHALMEDADAVESLKEDNILSEASKIVKITMNKDSQIQRLTTMMVFQIAREKGDKLFNKLVRTWKLKKFITKALYKKYGSQAKSRATKRYNTMKNSKNKTVRKAAK